MSTEDCFNKVATKANRTKASVKFRLLNYLSMSFMINKIKLSMETQISLYQICRLSCQATQGAKLK